MRYTVMVKFAYSELFLLVHPKALRPIKYGRSVVATDVMRSILSFSFLYFVFLGLSTVVMGLLGLDPLTALTSVATTMGGVGPGFGSVGPMDNYAHLPMLGKWVLAFCMLLGRLEIYTIILLFTPAFWRAAI